jgi:hypothetical protein
LRVLSAKALRLKADFSKYILMPLKEGLQVRYLAAMQQILNKRRCTLKLKSRADN